MLLFNIGMNPVLEEIDRISVGVTLANIRMTVFAYADDIAILSRTKQDLQTCLDTANNFIKWSGLDFQNHKCGILSLPNDAVTTYQLNNEPIPNIGVKESYKYLGVQISRDTKKIRDDAKKLENCVLLPHQKIRAYRIFLHSRLVFLSRNYNCFKTDFENVKGDLENSIQMSIKKFIGLPKRTSTAFLYADQKKGGLGLTSIKTEYALQSFRRNSENDT